MKSLYHHSVALLTILGMSILFGNDCCLSGDQPSAPELAKQVPQAEELWRTGQHREYYRKVGVVLTGLTAPTATNNTNKRLIADLFEGLLAKEANTDPDIDAEDIWAMRDLAFHILREGELSSDERWVNAQMLSKFLGKIRKETIPNYKRRLVTANVRVPVVGRPTQPLMAGMDPEAIDDPATRAAYKAAIQENDQNNFVNMRQSALRDAERKVGKAIIAYMAETFRAGDASSPLIAECIGNARLTDEEKKEVTGKISSAKGKDDK